MSSTPARAEARGRPRVGRCLILTALLAGLAGCAMVGPDFARPSTPAIEGWLAANAPTRNSTSGLTARSAPVVTWWETFGDPTLNSLIAEAYAQNLDLQIAGSRVMRARAQLGIARGELFPQSQSVGAAVNYREISDNLQFINDVERVTDLDLDFATSEVGFDATWELDVWGGIRRDVQSARANLAAEVADYDDALVTLTGDVAALYINIRALQEAIAIAGQNVNLQKESLDLVTLRFDNGVTTELDVQEATALLENTRALVPTLRSDLQQAINALSVLLAVPPARLSGQLGTGGIPTARTEVVAVPAELLRRRPDVRAAELEAAAQSAQIGVAISALYPQFILAGNIGFESTDTSDLFEAASSAYTFTPGVRWNVLNYGRLKNNVRAQDATFQGLVANYQNTVLAAYAEVSDAMSAYSAAGQEAGLLQRSVNASQRASEIAVVQYTDGVADYTRVLTTQQGLLAGQANLIEARAAVSENLVALYKALGGGWQIRQGREFLPDTVLAEMAYRTDWGDLIEVSSQGR